MSKRKHRNVSQSAKSAMTVRSNRLIDCVIPVHNRFDLLEKCLSALPDAIGDISHNVILFDNGSAKEDADAFYDKVSPEYTIVRAKDNLGFPKACNMGVQRKNSPLIFLLNSDVILEPGSVDLLVRDMDDPKVGAVGMLLIFPEEYAGLNPGIRPSGKVQHVGLASNVTGNIIHPLIGWSVDNPKVLAQREVLAVTGAALMTRRSIWLKCGGFDEIYGMGTYEEVDFQMKVHQLGYNVIVDVKARGIHYTGATAEKYQIAYPINQNRMIFLSKWMNYMPYTEYLHW